MIVNRVQSGDDLGALREAAAIVATDLAQSEDPEQRSTLARTLAILLDTIRRGSSKSQTEVGAAEDELDRIRRRHA